MQDFAWIGLQQAGDDDGDHARRGINKNQRLKRLWLDGLSTAPTGDTGRRARAVAALRLLEVGARLAYGEHRQTRSTEAEQADDENDRKAVHGAIVHTAVGHQDRRFPWLLLSYGPLTQDSGTLQEHSRTIVNSITT